MRLLFIPIYTNPANLNGCSSYNVGTKFLSVVSEDPRVYTYWYLPEGWKYQGEPSPLEKHPRIKVIRDRMYKEQYIETGFVPESIYPLFNQYSGKYHVDAVLTERPGSALYMKKLLAHPFTRMTKGPSKRWLGKVPPLVTFIRDPFVKTQDIHIISEVEEMAQTLGYLSSYNIFYSQNDLDIALNVAKRYLNFAQVRKIMNQSVVIPSGTDCDELDKIKEKIPKRKRFTVLVAERLQASENRSEILDAVDYLFRRGMDIDLVVSSQAGIGTDVLMKYRQTLEHVEVHQKNPRDKYLRLMNECHACITSATRHSYPQALMEQLYCGLIGVLPDKPWVDAVLPNYPFKFKAGSLNEMTALLKWITENYEEAKKRVAWVPEYIRKNYNVRETNQRMLDFIKEKTEEETSKITSTSGYVELMEDINDFRITEQELIRRVREKSRHKMPFNDPTVRMAFGHSKAMLFKIMREKGYYDTCEGEFVTFQKEETN